MILLLDAQTIDGRSSDKRRCAATVSFANMKFGNFKRYEFENCLELRRPIDHVAPPALNYKLCIVILMYYISNKQLSRGKIVWKMQMVQVGTGF